MLGAFKNQKKVTRSFGNAVSIIVPFFSFKKFLNKLAWKFIRSLLLFLCSQKIRAKQVNMHALNAILDLYQLITVIGNCISMWEYKRL